MLFARIAETSARVADSSSRRAKVTALAEVLREADDGERAAVVAFVAGRLRQRRTGVGYAALRSMPVAADVATLSVSDVDSRVAEIAGQRGPGSERRRAALLEDLLSRATRVEQGILAGLLAGELRQGAAEGLLLDAVAAAARVAPDRVRRAVTFGGDLLAVGAAVLDDPETALAASRLRPGRPFAPMLAASAPTLSAALERTGPAVVEWKLDGIRAQVHRSGRELRVFSRSLEELTDRLPGIVDAVGALPGGDLVLDGEVLARDEAGRPRPFQETSSLTARREPTTGGGLCLVVFDCLHTDGEDLLDAPLARRVEAVTALHLPTLSADPSGAAVYRVPGTVADPVAHPVPDVVALAEAEAATATAAGHEGVVVKSLASTYAAGRRGAAWVKVKPRHTLDLVVLAVEHGSGRRRGWLSNLHLGARDPEGRYGPPDGVVMLGKTFKGLSDDMLRWQTRRLGELAVADDGWCVRVRPELVVEVAFDGVQASPRYPAGMTLRFARVVAHRPDKPASEADTVAAVRRLHDRPRSGAADARDTAGPAGRATGRGPAPARES